MKQVFGTFALLLIATVAFSQEPRFPQEANPASTRPSTEQSVPAAPEFLSALSSSEFPQVANPARTAQATNNEKATYLTQSVSATEPRFPQAANPASMSFGQP